MHNEYLGKSWCSWVALTVIIVALFLFSRSQGCSVSIASVLMILPF